MTKAIITQALPEDAALLRLRASDLREATEWAPGSDPAELVKASILGSEDAFTVWNGTEVVAICGWAFDGPGRITPWLLGSDLVSKNRKELMRRSRQFLSDLRKVYPDRLLCNHVAKANTPARLFLTALGFTIVPSPGSGEFDFFYILPCVPSPSRP